MKRKPKGKVAVAVPPSFKPLVTAYSRKPGVTIEKGWGSSSVVLKVKKKIFAMQLRDDLVLKLPREKVDELVARSAGKRFDPRGDGRVMKEWIVLRKGAAGRVDLAGEALEFVRKG